MDLRATPNLIHLSESGQRSVQLETARGFRIVAISGDVWVTQAGFIEDYILRPGDALLLESDGPAVVTSFGPADVEVIAPAARSPMPELSPVVTSEIIEQARSEAERLRAQALQEAFGAVSAWIRRLGRRAVAAAECAVGTGDGHRHL